MDGAFEQDVAIAGAGIGGLLSAIALAREGFRVTVFERASALRPGGGALILWCNALKALDIVGLRRELCAAATAQIVEVAEFRRHDGEFLTSLPVAEVGLRHDAETLVISRRDLLKTLLSHASPVANVRFSVGITDFRTDEKSVVLFLSDGSEHRCAGLVGADGLHSTVRERLHGAQPLRHTQQRLWVGTAECDAALPPGLTVATPGAGKRFWHTLLGDGRVFWYAAMPSGTSSDEDCTLSTVCSTFTGWHDPIPAVLRATREEDALHTTMRDRPPSLPWGVGRITLLGDAAHPMTPDLGQGACQAIESAIVLGASVSRERDLPSGFRRYERRRFARTASLTRLSWLVAHSSSVADRTLCTLRDGAMRFGMRASIMSQLDWLFASVC